MRLDGRLDIERSDNAMHDLVVLAALPEEL